MTIMSLSGGLNSYYISAINAALFNWNLQQKRGKVFESSAGFLLPDGSMRAPDVAFVAREKWQGLTRKQQAQFLPLCPDFVVELRSPTDRLATLHANMEAWIANGCRLAWLIDPQAGQVHLYRPGASVEVLSGFDRVLSGEGILEGFQLDLAVLLEE